ncbi:MAG: hypothetical protein MR296_00785 [Tenericutes bacterium]|nr:hypothetical protein [Mycoplasmatota bacterium]
MLKEQRLYNIRKESGLNYNNKAEVERAIEIASSVTNSISLENKEIKESVKNDLINGVLSLKDVICVKDENIKELLSNAKEYLKYKGDLIALKLKVKELYLKKEINDTSLSDIILSLEMLDVVCDMKIDALRKIKDDTLKQDDITSSDSKNLYINKEGGTVIIPKVSYLFLMGREAIKYAPVKAAKETMKGARKILKKVNNKNNKKTKSN